MRYVFPFIVAALALVAIPAHAQVSVINSADTAEYEFEWTPGVASTTYGGAPAGNARSLYIQNRSSATCYIRFDAQNVTTAGATGYKLAAGDEKSWDILGGFASSMRAACTAALSTGAALWTSWWT